MVLGIAWREGWRSGAWLLEAGGVLLARVPQPIEDWMVELLPLRLKGCQRVRQLHPRGARASCGASAVIVGSTCVPSRLEA